MGVETYLEERGSSLSLFAERLTEGAGDILFVTGSIVDGTGDDDSDLEIYLLTDEDGFARREGRFLPQRRAAWRTLRSGVIRERVGTLDIEVRVHLRATFEALLDALGAMDPTRAGELLESFDRLGSFDRRVAVELLHALEIGEPATERAAFEALRRRMDRRRFAVWNVHRALLSGREVTGGARASLRSGDVENAYVKLAFLYDELADAFLFARGVSIDRWKWRLPKLRALGRTPFLERYLDVRLLRRDAREPLGEFVARQLDAAGELAQRLSEDAGIGTVAL